MLHLQFVYPQFHQYYSIVFTLKQDHFFLKKKKKKKKTPNLEIGCFTTILFLVFLVSLNKNVKPSLGVACFTLLRYFNKRDVNW